MLGPGHPRGRSRDAAGFSGLSQTKHLPAGDTGVSHLPGEGHRPHASLERRLPSDTAQTPTAAGLGRKLCPGSLTLTSQRLTQEQRNTFRLLTKGRRHPRACCQDTAQEGREAKGSIGLHRWQAPTRLWCQPLRARAAPAPGLLPPPPASCACNTPDTPKPRKYHLRGF